MENKYYQNYLIFQIEYLIINYKSNFFTLVFDNSNISLYVISFSDLLIIEDNFNLLTQLSHIENHKFPI